MARNGELTPDDLRMRGLPPLDLSRHRVQDTIEPVDGPVISDEVAMTAFMEEPVTVMLEHTNERYQAPIVGPFGVNGEHLWFPVGVPVKIKRKFLEVLARAQPWEVRTHHQDATVERPINEVLRTQRKRYPFSLIADENPKGRDWLRKVMMEA